MQRTISLADFIIKVAPEDERLHERFVRFFGDRCEWNTKNISKLYYDQPNYLYFSLEALAGYDEVKAKMCELLKQQELSNLNSLARNKQVALLVNLFDVIVEMPRDKFRRD